jgi:two-component sensor histidine kinase
MIFTTLLLCLLNLACPQRVSWRLEGLLGLVSVLLVSLLVIQPEIVGLPPSSIRPYPMLPFLLWLALRTDVRYVAVAMAWIFGAMSTHAVWEPGGVSVILDGEWIRPLHGATFVIGLSFLALAVLMGANRRLVAVSLAEALAQKDALIREVHHRIKNNLQIVAGLLRRDAAMHPEVKPFLETAINQVQSIAVVHGLHGRVTQQGVMLCELLPAISRSISELSGMPVSLEGIEEGRGNMRVQETESVALALILNELLSNAVKHMRPTPDTPGPKVTLLGENGSGRISISNPGQLPPGFDYSRGVGLGTGLGLVKALAPSPGVMIDIQQKGNQVLTEMRLGPPLLTIGERGA